MPENRPVARSIHINKIPIIPRSFLEEAIVGARVMAESAPDIKRVTPRSDPSIVTFVDTQGDVMYSAEQEVEVETVRGRAGRITLNSYVAHKETKDGNYGDTHMKIGQLVGTRRYRD
jgi:hypothetical protein